jgi:hypothetical protein
MFVILNRLEYFEKKMRKNYTYIIFKKVRSKSGSGTINPKSGSYLVKKSRVRPEPGQQHLSEMRSESHKDARKGKLQVTNENE